MLLFVLFVYKQLSTPDADAGGIFQVEISQFRVGVSGDVGPALVPVFMYM